MSRSIGDFDRVELLSEDGQAIGSSTKLEAHRPPGRLHRGFSVFLFDSDGRVLLQRRARTKYHFAGRWSNACCSHPPPGADVAHAARARLDQELGVLADLLALTSFRYSAADPVSGLVEREVDDVFVGYLAVGASVEPDRDEVDAVRYVELDKLSAEMAGSAGGFTPWLAEVLEVVRAAGHPQVGHD